MKSKTIIFSTFIIIILIIGIFSIIGMYERMFGYGEGGEIEIVVSVPLGWASGEAIKNSVELAFEEVNYKVENFDINIVVLDDGDSSGAWDGDLERKNAEYAVGNKDVMAYIGTFNSGAAKISIPILNKAGLLQISPANTWPGLTKPGFAPEEPGIFYPTGVRNYFRVCTTDDNQGPAGALWAKELGFNSVFIVDDGEAYGKGIADLFRSKATELNMEVFDQVTIDKRASSHKELLSVIRSHNPDLIYYGGTTPNGIAIFVQEMREIGIESAVMGPDGIVGQDFIDRIGAEDASGIYATTVGVDAEHVGTKEALAFRDSYVARYGIEPEPFAVLGYETAHVVINALKAVNGKKDRKALIDAVGKTRNFSKLLEPWSFTNEGDTTYILMSGNVVKDGKFEFVKKLTPPEQ